MRNLVLILALVLPSLANGQQAQQPTIDRGKVPHGDDGIRDPSFARFRRNLVEAVKRRDLKFLESALADKVEVGGEDRVATREHFIASMAPSSSVAEDTWRDLARILRAGAAGSPGGPFCVPYCADFEEREGPNQELAIMGYRVPVYSAPRTRSQVIDTLSWDIVEWLSRDAVLNGTRERVEGEVDQWYKIVTPGGKVGFVHGMYVRGHWGVYACFTKINGQWKMDTFRGGD
jgi:hypothetical protein